MKLLLVYFLLFSHLIYADKQVNSNTTKETNSSTENAKVLDQNVTDDDISLIEEALKQRKVEVEKRLEEEKRQKAILREQKRMEEKQALRTKIDALVEAKEQLDKELQEDNIWASRYMSYETYKDLKVKLKKVEDEINVFKAKKSLNEVQKRELKKLQDKAQIISGKITQLEDYKSDPFKEYIKAIELEGEPVVTNPLDIITALSYKKHLATLSEENERKYASLLHAVDKIEQKKALLERLAILSDDRKHVKELSATKVKLKDFELAKAVFETSMETFSQTISQMNINIDKGIEKEIKKSIVTGVIILFLLLAFLLVKYLVRKYMSDNDLFYSINKVVNFIFIFMVFIILLLTYLENVENFTTILSFASAGIAIALKDWFMSVLGWLVILVSGSIHVGDRVRFVKDGIEYVGDIVDISILRMTLHEDVTLTTVMVNKRSGRIVFIPNNYIFTDMIANYSHSGLKTVWDGIEFIVTFDSNIAKAQAITKEVTRQYSKGYTDMTRKQLNRLRSKYSVRNTGVEPRIFTIIEPYGLRITGWYLTNSYATLTLRTTISVEVISRIQKEDDIQLALPSQSLYMNKPLTRAPLADGDEPTENHKPIS